MPWASTRRRWAVACFEPKSAVIQDIGHLNTFNIFLRRGPNPLAWPKWLNFPGHSTSV